MLSTVITVLGVLVIALGALVPFYLVLFCGEGILRRIPFGTWPRFLLLMLRSLRRNLLRTSLTYLAIFVLVIVVTTVWSVLQYLDDLMTEKTRDLKAIVTEKWGAQSHMPFTYAYRLSQGAADPNRPDDARPLDNMTWQIYVGTLDADKKTRESFVFVIGLEPSKLLSMMDELLAEIMPAQRQYGLEQEQRRQLEAAVAQMIDNKRGLVIGHKKLEALKKAVGDRITLTGMNYEKLDLEFEIVGVLPHSGKYDEAAFMNRDYLNDALDAYARKNGTKHKMADKSLDIVWLKVADQPTYGKVAEQIEASGHFHNPSVKTETLSSAVATVMESYRDLVWGMRWLLSPAIVVTMALVVANAISLGVRERRLELAVLKVLGFRPSQVLALVLGEALLIGVISGGLSTSVSFVLVNVVLAVVNPMPAAVPTSALWWGPVLGGGTALAGSLLPAVQACRVRASEAFARVT